MTDTDPQLGEGSPNQDLVLDGDLVIRDVNNTVRLRLNREDGTIFIFDASGNTVFQMEMPGLNLRLGGHGRDGDLLMFRSDATNIADGNAASVRLNAQAGGARFGGNGANGRLALQSTSGAVAVSLEANDGTLHLATGDGTPTIRMSGQTANVRLGGGDADGDILLFPENANPLDNDAATIHLNGNTGTVRVDAITFADGSSQSSAPQSGVITGVSAGDGLVGGGTSGDVALSIDPEVGQAILSLGNRVSSLELAVQTIQLQINQIQFQLGQLGP